MKIATFILLSSFFVGPSFAQVVLFEDDFSEGLTNWTAEAPWYHAPEGENCIGSSNPPPDYGDMVRMGDPDCNFNSLYHVPTTLISTDPISIPLYADNPRLTFDSFIQSEACNGWDHHDVYVSVDGGLTWIHIGEDCSPWGVWHANEFDLSPFAGQGILVNFHFNAVDAWGNDGLGWLIDNVKISTDACTHENYCVAAPNTASPTGAIIGHTGSKRIHLNSFALTLTDGPPGQFAHFFFGPFEEQLPVANGFLCVGTDAFGYRRLHPGGQIDANGYLEDAVDFTALTGTHTILPGMRLNFQCWYRDFENGISTSNFSDARSVTFCP